MLKAVCASMLARCYDRAMQRTERQGLSAWRQELLAHAQGKVLEIGSGTGLNLPYYPEQVELTLSEPDRHMRSQLQQRLGQRQDLQPQLTAWPAEQLPCADASFDTLVATLVLCSVESQPQVLAELLRVLKPGGKLLFIEHVRATDPATARWQQRLDPFWSYCCGNCHLTRDTGSQLESAGFQLQNCCDADLPAAPAIVRRSLRGIAYKPLCGKDLA